jgi:hypothetical protein
LNLTSFSFPFPLLILSSFSALIFSTFSVHVVSFSPFPSVSLHSLIPRSVLIARQSCAYGPRRSPVAVCTSISVLLITFLALYHTVCNCFNLIKNARKNRNFFSFL